MMSQRIAVVSALAAALGASTPALARDLPARGGVRPDALGGGGPRCLLDSEGTVHGSFSRTLAARDRR